MGAISKLHPLHARETVRLFFGVGGPNFTSSFDEIFDKVYNLGGLANPPLEGIRTVTVAPGGAVITEFKLHVPGNYTIVDHALARVERGLAGLLIVERAPNADLYSGTMMPGIWTRFGLDRDFAVDELAVVYPILNAIFDPIPIVAEETDGFVRGRIR